MVVRLVVVLASAVLTGLSLVHSASESDPLLLGQVLRLDGSISANAIAEAVSLLYLQEVAARQAEALGETNDLTPEQIVQLQSSQQVLAQLPTGHLPDELRSRAERAFLVDPLEISTLRIIALGTILPENEARGRAAMEQIFALNKRDLFTSLWLANFALGANDLDGAMERFDVALRTSGTARQLAMKPFVNLLQWPEADAPLGALLQGNPDWEEDFWREYFYNAIALRNSARFFASSGVGLDRLEPGHQALLFRRLRDIEAYDVLIALRELNAADEANFFGPDAEAMPDPLGWRLNSQGGFASYWIPQSGHMQLNAQPGVFGTFADRIVNLGDGQVLRVALASAVPPDIEISARILCATGNGRELAGLQLHPGETEASAPVAAAPECRYGRLELRFDNQDNRRSALLEVADVSLV